MYIHEQNSLCHCSNFAVWSCLPRGPLEISSLSSKQIETSRGTGIRANLWLRATSTGTDQLTASRVTFSVALFRGTRRPFSSSLFVCLCFALSLSLCFSLLPPSLSASLSPSFVYSLSRFCFSSLLVLFPSSLNFPSASFSLPLVYFLSQLPSRSWPPAQFPGFGVGPFVQDTADVTRPYRLYQWRSNWSISKTTCHLSS